MRWQQALLVDIGIRNGTENNIEKPTLTAIYARKQQLPYKISPRRRKLLPLTTTYYVGSMNSVVRAVDGRIWLQTCLWPLPQR